MLTITTITKDCISRYNYDDEYGVINLCTPSDLYIRLTYIDDLFYKFIFVSDDRNMMLMYTNSKLFVIKSRHAIEIRNNKIAQIIQCVIANPNETKTDIINILNEYANRINSVNVKPASRFVKFVNSL